MMEDVQGRHDDRSLAIDEVGIQGLRLPVRVNLSAQNPQATVGRYQVSVHLPHDRKGTHMSRMVALATEFKELSLESFADLLNETRSRLDSERARVRIDFTYFLEKSAPVTHESSLMDYDVRIEGTTSKTGHTIWLSVTVPVTSLCPCSKKISDYGAHNQRSEIRITVEPAGAIHLDELIRIAEREASSELFAILKRPDEKAVTERAYDNPKFVEDLVRDVAQALHHHQAVKSFEVTVENFESIHNHSAIATIKHQR